jgi:hypothetical protein
MKSTTAAPDTVPAVVSTARQAALLHAGSVALTALPCCPAPTHPCRQTTWPSPAGGCGRVSDGDAADWVRLVGAPAQGGFNAHLPTARACRGLRASV